MSPVLIYTLFYTHAYVPFKNISAGIQGLVYFQFIL
jgi:hypothetical protein